MQFSRRTKRIKLKTNLFLRQGLILTSILFTCVVYAEKFSDRPNFVIILTDDQGYSDLGVYGSSDLQTPNIDKMAEEGIRFTDFEMSFTNKDKMMNIQELYAIGPAISILIEGYVEKDKLISLRGTLVPATTINRSIASIPLIGDLLIGKKTGEGVFGVSFKVKGPPKNLETTVNPIKTLTPRFITRTLEKIKKN